MTSTARVPAVVGLLVAWGGTALLVSPLGDRLGDPTSLSAALLAQALLWLLFAVVVVIVLLWEKLPLASLWLRPFQWQSLVWAGVLFVANLLLVFPTTEWIRQAVGLAGYAAGMEPVMLYSVWFRVLASVTAGVVEETLFRGFAVTRLLQLTGSPLLAVVLSSGVAALLHFPWWGAGPALAWFLGGLATTAFFVWRRDLLAMILFHAAGDIWGLSGAPALSRWWTE